MTNKKKTGFKPTKIKINEIVNAVVTKKDGSKRVYRKLSKWETLLSLFTRKKFISK